MAYETDSGRRGRAEKILDTLKFSPFINRYRKKICGNTPDILRMVLTNYSVKRGRMSKDQMIMRDIFYSLQSPQYNN